MVILKPNPVGIDVPIQLIQEGMFTYLCALWNMQPADYACYGRCYRNYTDTKGYLPEVFIGGKDYKDAFYNDKVTATSFFGITSGRSTLSEGLNTANVHLIFSVNLDKVKSIARADEEVRADVQKLLEQYISTDIDRITDIDRVYSEYTAWRTNDNTKLSDMHPKHCFRFNFDVTYNTLDCPQPLISELFN